MTPSGLAHIDAAKVDARWESAYVVSEMKIPADFLAAVKEKPNLKLFFETLNKSHQNTIAHGLTSAKKSETRQKRFLKFSELLAEKQKP